MSQDEESQSPRKALPPTALSERPARNRKRNSRFFNDDEDTNWAMGRSPRKKAQSEKSTPKSPIKSEHKTPQPGPQPKTKQRIAHSKGPDKQVINQACNRLKNLLKLPKAHKWVVYEFFYSNIDDCLFHAENEFSNYLKQSFPYLKTRNLTRTEWSKIRRFMGKPRRCSSAFFAEEVRSLHEKRESVRHLQQRLITKLSQVDHLPTEIPLSLVIGTRIIAHVHSKDGLFVGTIDAVDTQNASYRISFDRPELGTVSIPDYEVLSLQKVEKMPIEFFIQRPRVHPTPRALFPGSQRSDADPLLSSSINDSGKIYGGGFPVDFLTLIVQLTKILTEKKNKIQQLKEMNAEAERSLIHRQFITHEFRKKYACLVMDFVSLNHDLEESMEGIHKYSEELSPEQDHSFMAHPLAAKTKVSEEATNIVEVANGDPLLVTDVSNIELIKNLIMILLQIKNATEKKQSSFELKSLEDAIKDVENSLISPRNLPVFQNQVEVHLMHIKNILTRKTAETLKIKLEPVDISDKK